MPSDSVLEEIKTRIDIVDFISEYVHLKHAGQNWKGLCPFHAEKTPSFTVSPSKQIYHCFGCASGGDIFSFLVRYENLSFPEAVRALAKRAGVELKVSQKDAARTGEKEILLNMHRDALVFFQQQLARNAKAGEYLNKRGINIEAQKLFSLGYALKTWDALLTFLVRKGHKAEMIKKAGLVTQGTKGIYDTFRDRIMFPIYDLKGEVIAFGGRTISGDDPKYLNSPETLIFNKGRVLYGLHRAKEAIKKTGQALFMEGYIDVIMAHMHGFSNSVAPLGTALTPEHGKLIKRFVEDATLVFDGDEAGMSAAKRAANVLLESGLNVRILSFPDKEDPDSFLRKKGAEGFRKLLDAPLSIVDFFMLQKKDRRMIAHEALETISRMPDNVLQGQYVKMLSEKLMINEIFIREEFNKIRNLSARTVQTAAPKPGLRTKTRPSEEVSLIKLLLQLPETIGKVSGVISEGDFKDVATRTIFKKIMGGLTDFNELLSTCEGEEKDFLTEISLRDDFDNPEKGFDDCIKRITGNKRKRQLQELQGKIQEAESRKDFKLLKLLQAQHQEITRKKG
ncbi:MAG: DNA primase [Nitrospiraceae bacterium]|nr:MAG: DNA primase [Nitrospiraceae bacterium]